jgi:hypothetical protein
MTRILGIDPGLVLCGYGVIDFDLRRPKLIDGGVIRLSEKRSVAERLVESGNSTPSSPSTSRGRSPSSSCTPTTPTRAPRSSWATPAA